MDNSNRDGVFIVSWNTNSVYPKRHELLQFVADNDVDILLLQETFLRPHTIFNIPNYSVYRNDRTDRGGGGTAVVVKNSLKHRALANPALSDLEATMIEIFPAEEIEPIRIISAYRSPGPNHDQNFEEDLGQLLGDNVPILLAGDLNAHHRSWSWLRTTRAGKKLNHFINVNMCNLLLPDKATHRYTLPDGQIRGSILDFALTKNILGNLSIKTIEELSSDHYPIGINLSLVFQENPPTFRRVTYWPAFKAQLEEQTSVPAQIVDQVTLDEATIQLTGEITRAFESASKNVPAKSHNPHSLPRDIKDLMSERNGLLRELRRTLDPRLKPLINRANKNIRERIKIFRSEKWSEFLEEIDSDNTRQQLWNIQRKLRRRRPPMIPIRGPNGDVFSPEDKAEVFADSLESQFQVNQHLNDDPLFDQQVQLEVGNLLQQVPQLQVTPSNPEEIKSIIKSLHPKKAPGPDKISNAVLKNLPENTIQVIVQITNAIISLRKFPTPWKYANVILIAKPKKDHSRPENYRPISLLTTLSKVTEKVILQRVADFVDENHILPDEQFGFRKDHDTVMQLARVKGLIAKGINRRKTVRTGAVFLDVQKAFDKVWHDGLLYKMHTYNFPLQLIQLIGAYLQNRSFKVCIDGHLSSQRNISAGVPQGSSISPLLYSIFTADIPKLPNVDLALFADDTCVLAQSSNVDLVHQRLQRQLDALSIYFSKWKIEVNPDKTEALMISRGQDRSPANLRWKDSPILWREKAKYLGLVFNRRLTWTDHIHSRISHVNGICEKLYPLLSDDSKLSIRARTLLFKVVVRPALLYACQIWVPTFKTHLKPMRGYLNRLHRRIAAAPWYVRNTDIRRDLELEDLEEYTQKMGVGLYNRTSNHPNPQVHIIFANQGNERRQKSLRSFLVERGENLR